MGVYAEFDDVAKRFEGDVPEDRRDWVELRIDDVEAELIGLVPALAPPNLPQLSDDRIARVLRLVCDKVLALFRNPDGALTVSNSMGPYSESRTLPGSRVQSGSWVAFTADELASVGYVKTAGSAGSVTLRAWHYERP